MKHHIRILVVTGLVAVSAGCAMQPTKNGESRTPFCMLMGGALGGGTAAAISLAAAPVGAGVLLGSTIAAFICREEPAMPVSEPVAVATPPPTPAPMVEMDSDGDGVMDSLDRCPGTPPGTKVDVHGCPAILLTLTGVNFKFDSSELETDSEQILDQAVKVLNDAPGVNVRVEGHTDSVGTDAYNIDLSQRRADAVQAYLISHGIPAARLTTSGKGEGSPVAPNTTAEGRFQNRRVEFHVVGDGM